MRKRILILMLAGIIGSMPAIPAMADAETQTSAQSSSETDTQSAKSFISFGKDLTSSQKDKVLEYFGLSESDLSGITTITISNSDEHKYLDDYLPAKTIGTRALSSVYIKPADKDSGINVTTKNITYCTTGMYENAMTTAGLKDVNVIVAGPSPISGTAALVGATEAYSKMTGDKVDEDKVDAAVDEIVTTGQIEQSQEDEDNPNYTASAGKDGSSSTVENSSDSSSSENASSGSTSDQSVESLLADLKQKVASGEIKKSEISDAVKDEAEDHNVSLSDEEVQKITDLLEKISKLDLDVNALSSQADSLMEKLDKLTDNQNKTSREASGFFAKIGEFFSNLAKRLHLS